VRWTCNASISGVEEDEPSPVFKPKNARQIAAEKVLEFSMRGGFLAMEIAFPAASGGAIVAALVSVI